MQEPEGADYFTVSHKHGRQYIMLTAGRWIIVVDSGASRCLFHRRSMFTTYKLVDRMYVDTASGEQKPVVSTGTVGGISNCQHVSTLVKDQLFVPHMDVSMGWRTIFEAGA